LHPPQAYPLNFRRWRDTVHNAGKNLTRRLGSAGHDMLAKVAASDIGCESRLAGQRSR
jgi:hypothetical protein